VLLSSHILAEVERLCDRVTIIRQGRAVQQGTLEELRHLTRTSITVATERPLDGLESLVGVHNIEVDVGHVHFEVDGSALDAAVRHLSTFGIHSLVSRPPTLEELFLRHYGDDLAPEVDAAAAAERS
jgi:ABC-2 type transport system ATP-binding protein